MSFIMNESNWIKKWVFAINNHVSKFLLRWKTCNEILVQEKHKKQTLFSPQS
jgi:hypothetical protein